MSEDQSTTLMVMLKTFLTHTAGKKRVIGRIQFSGGVIFQIVFDPDYNQQKTLVSNS